MFATNIEEHSRGFKNMTLLKIHGQKKSNVKQPYILKWDLNDWKFHGIRKKKKYRLRGGSISKMLEEKVVCFKETQHPWALWRSSRHTPSIFESSVSSVLTIFYFFKASANKNSFFLLRLVLRPLSLPVFGSENFF